MFTASEKTDVSTLLRHVLNGGEPWSLSEARALMKEAQDLHRQINCIVARAALACADHVGVDIEAEIEEFSALSQDSRAELFGPIDERIEQRELWDDSYLEAAE